MGEIDMVAVLNRALNRTSNLFIFLFLSSLVSVSFITADVADKKTVQLPKSHQVSVDFKNTVEKYIRATKRHCLEPLRKNKEIELPFFRELFYLFGRLEQSLTVRQSIVLISRARAEHHKMMQSGIDVHSETFAHAEAMYGALLLKCSSVLIDNARMQLLAILEEVDNSLSYWEKQEKHHIKYFFSKSPLKWITGKKQASEIADNIKILGKLKYSIRVVLGKVTMHVHTVDMVDGIDSCYAWVDELLSLLSCIKIKEEVGADDNRFAQSAEQLQHKISRVLYLKRDILSKSNIVFTQKSSHLVRHWVPYAAAIAGAAYLGTYHLDDLNRMFGIEALLQYRTSIGERLSKNVTATKEIMNSIFGKGTSGKKIDGTLLDENKEKTTDEIITELEVKAGLQKVANKLGTLVRSADIASTREALSALLDKLILDPQGTGVTQALKNEIIDAEISGNYVPFQSIFNKMDKNFYGNIYQRDDFLNALIILAELKIYHQGISLAQVINEVIDEYGFVLIKKLFQLIAGAEAFAAQKEEVDEQLYIIKNLVILTPAFGMTYLGYSGVTKGYEWLTARDYVAIRIALAEVNSLFIESPLPLDDHDYGKLVYLLHKLKNKALYLLPTKDKVCERFLKDIAKLESQDFTAETKRLIISNMYNKYPFLIPSAKRA
jgi:ATP synthase regulation protein NCA2